MFRHIVLFRWKPEATQEQIDAVFEGLAALPAQIPEVAAFAFGADAGLREGTFDAGVVADFADEEAYATYAGHPAHQALIAERIGPVVAERVAVQHHL